MKVLFRMNLSRIPITELSNFGLPAQQPHCLSYTLKKLHKHKPYSKLFENKTLNAKILIMCLLPSFQCLITLCFECWLHFVHEIKHLLLRESSRVEWMVMQCGFYVVEIKPFRWVGDLCLHVVSDELAVIVITNCIRVEDWTGYISHCPQVGPVLARLLCCTCGKSGVDLFTLIFRMQLVSCAQVSRQSSVIQALYSSFLIILFSVWLSQFILTLD